MNKDRKIELALSSNHCMHFARKHVAELKVKINLKIGCNAA